MLRVTSRGSRFPISFIRGGSNRVFSSFLNDGKTEEVENDGSGKKNAIQLSKEESELFSMFTRMIADTKIKTTVRVAGGWVRDKLIGLQGKPDIDIALDNMSGKEFAVCLNNWNAKTQVASNLTSAQPHINEVTGLPYIKFGVIKSNPKQSKHLETATANVGMFSIDFVNLRTEQYAKNSRIPVVHIGTPREDAERRDLTINSLFYNLNSEEVEDFTGRGLSDLKRGRVDTPLPPLTTLQDDPLRALRAVRFACRFQFDMSEGVIRAARHRKVHLALQDKVSRERVKLEVYQLISQNDPGKVARAANMLDHLNLLSLVLTTNPLNVSDVWRVHADGSTSVQGAETMLRNFCRRGLNTLILCTGLATAMSTENEKSLYTQELQDIREINAYKDNVPAGYGDDSCTLARFAALTAGVADWEYSPRGVTSIPVSDHILSVNLKMSKKETETVNTINACSRQFSQLLQELLKYNQKKKIVDQLDSTSVMSYKCLDRARVGLIMRTAGPLYLYALEQAVATTLLTELTNAQLSINDGPASEEQALIDLNHMLSDILFGSTNSFQSNFKLKTNHNLYNVLLSGPSVDTTVGDDVLEAGRDLIAGIRYMNLHDDYNAPPLINGKQIMTILPHITPGPLFGQVMAEATRWALSMPLTDRTHERLIEHLKIMYKG
jgi:tRNA nucleotidyltransferase/poly(A) polymerase